MDFWRKISFKFKKNAEPKSQAFNLTKNFAGVTINAKKKPFAKPTQKIKMNLLETRINLRGQSFFCLKLFNINFYSDVNLFRYICTGFS
jgi:hypothetical protein